MIKVNTSKPNWTIVELGNLTLWFSYATCVAFQIGGMRRVSENQWSVTTGKHMTQEFGKGGRMPAAEFNRELELLQVALEIVAVPATP